MSRRMAKALGDLRDLRVAGSVWSSAPALAVPDLEVVAHADHDHVLLDAACADQRRRQRHAAGRVELDVERAAAEEAGELARCSGLSGLQPGRERLDDSCRRPRASRPPRRARAPSRGPRRPRRRARNLAGIVEPVLRVERVLEMAPESQCPCSAWKSSDRSGGVGGAPPLRSCVRAAIMPHFPPLCNTFPHIVRKRPSVPAGYPWPALSAHSHAVCAAGAVVGALPGNARLQTANVRGRSFGGPCCDGLQRARVAAPRPTQQGSGQRRGHQQQHRRDQQQSHHELDLGRRAGRVLLRSRRRRASAGVARLSGQRSASGAPWRSRAVQRGDEGGQRGRGQRAAGHLARARPSSGTPRRICARRSATRAPAARPACSPTAPSACAAATPGLHRHSQQVEQRPGARCGSRCRAARAPRARARGPARGSRGRAPAPGSRSPSRPGAAAASTAPAGRGRQRGREP